MSDDFANLSLAATAKFADLSWIPVDFAFGSGDALMGPRMPYPGDVSMGTRMPHPGNALMGNRMPYPVDQPMTYASGPMKYVGRRMNYVDGSMLMGGGLPGAAMAASAEMAPPGVILSDPFSSSISPFSTMQPDYVLGPGPFTPPSDFQGASPSSSDYSGLAVLADAAACNGKRGKKSHVLAPAPQTQPQPATITPNTTPRGSIVSASSPSSSFGPSTPGAGPTSQRYDIPPRPKPGRKPATDEPASKRKAQNRLSQRNFRARKVAKLEEMQSTLDATERQHREELRVVESTLNHEVAERVAEIADLRTRLDEKTQAAGNLENRTYELENMLTRALEERDFWKAQAERVESDRQALKANNADLTVQLIRANESISSTPSPTEVTSGRVPEDETDFTTGNFTSFNDTIADRNCGFCDRSSDKSLCPCDMAAAATTASKRG